MNFCALVSALDWMFMPQVPYHVRTQGKDPHLWTKKPALTRHQICLHLDLGLPASQTLRNKCLQFKLPSLCCYYRSWNWLRQFSSVQFSHSVVSNSLRPHESQHARPPCPAPTPRARLKLMSIESVMPSSHLILCLPLLLPLSVFPSIRIFSNESVLRIRWPKHWSYSFRIGHSNEYWGKISIRIKWFDLLTVQGTLKSLLQHHRLKLSVLVVI